ncbi:hypothetical protein [Dolichospermum heterosporum]|uniref:Uncharacterized protein n=1 Tax=Dolichospermum heterosporum TAC447 TaxID=747523 RepID=A0ABY5LS88_9CYAN|nr:hypothetical protein [Dolichospermum heterosporum]UUO14812.1 hypothetical protein NG743_22780 [Dolichospermum heterosporum TAC447]
MNFFSFIAEALGASFTEEKVKDKLEKDGLTSWSAWVISAVGVSGLVHLIREMYSAYDYEAVEVLLPYLNTGVKNAYGKQTWKKQGYAEWIAFEDYNEFQKWFEGQSQKYQQETVSFWARWEKPDPASVRGIRDEKWLKKGTSKAKV